MSDFNLERWNSEVKNWSSQTNAWNNQVIEEFRAIGGKVGGTYEGAVLLLLSTTGARSGKRRTTPLAYLIDGERLIVAASVLGAAHHPAWYHNLVAHPTVTVELGPETFDATATVIAGKDRERLWAWATKQWPLLAEHQAKTARQIPLVALQR
jgi:deazaflavin-dependent oxidoreductase (nitroreductase family)